MSVTLHHQLSAESFTPTLIPLNPFALFPSQYALPVIVAEAAAGVGVGVGLPPPQVPSQAPSPSVSPTSAHSAGVPKMQVLLSQFPHHILLPPGEGEGVGSVSTQQSACEHGSLNLHVSKHPPNGSHTCPHEQLGISLEEQTPASVTQEGSL